MKHYSIYAITILLGLFSAFKLGVRLEANKALATGNDKNGYVYVNCFDNTVSETVVNKQPYVTHFEAHPVGNRICVVYKD